MLHTLFTIAAPAAPKPAEGPHLLRRRAKAPAMFIALLAAAVVLPACDVALPEESGDYCRSVTFRSLPYTVCTFRADRDDIRLFYADGEAGQYLQFNTLADTLEGATNLHEAIGALVRSALDDEDLVSALKVRLEAYKQRAERLGQRVKAKRDVARTAMEEAGIDKILAEAGVAKMTWSKWSCRPSSWCSCTRSVWASTCAIRASRCRLCTGLLSVATTVSAPHTVRCTGLCKIPRRR